MLIRWESSIPHGGGVGWLYIDIVESHHIEVEQTDTKGSCFDRIIHKKCAFNQDFQCQTRHFNIFHPKMSNVALFPSMAAIFDF